MTRDWLAAWAGRFASRFRVAWRRAAILFAAVFVSLSGCPKGADTPVEADREPIVAAQPDRDVLVSALAGDVPQRVLALEALIASEPIDAALGFATAGRFSAEQEVRVATVRALAARMPDRRVQALLRDVITTDESAVLRSYAALALVYEAQVRQAPWFAALPRPWTTSGSGIGVAIAAFNTGNLEAGTEVATVLAAGTLPAEPALIRALGTVPGVDWSDVTARAEPEAVHHAWCAAAVARFPGALAAAIQDARTRDADGIDDAVDAWVACPSPVAVSVLRALPGEVAQLALVARGGAGIGIARRALDGESWIDAIRALSLRGEDGHAILREWAPRQDDVRREVVAVALVGTAVAGDSALVDSFRTDASLRTRTAAAAIRLGGIGSTHP